MTANLQSRSLKIWAATVAHRFKLPIEHDYAGAEAHVVHLLRRTGDIDGLDDAQLNDRIVAEFCAARRYAPQVINWTGGW